MAHPPNPFLNAHLNGTDLVMVSFLVVVTLSASAHKHSPAQCLSPRTPREIKIQGFQFGYCMKRERG